ncbi:MAG TPA: hypothetical protein VGX37_01860 [Allosphingosinicella sp.]|nr:hypothetical protein [Allosphingosinicella sp.]
MFPNALIAHSLAFCPQADDLRTRINDFLLGEMDRHGLWRHWTREHPNHAQLPADLDDTGCASGALLRAGRPLPDIRDLLLANRNRQGLFYTWIVPRLRWTGLRHMRVALGPLRHPIVLFLFFRRTSAAPDDLDAVVNANALYCLGGFAGASAVTGHLVAVLRERREAQCDKWYENPFAIWYFFSRALSGLAPEARELVEARVGAAEPATALEDALAVCSLNYWRAPVPPQFVEFLIERQLQSGAWPRAALYHGGRARRRDGSFDPPHPDTPRWGGEALTTAFCLEALCGLDRGREGDA